MKGSTFSAGPLGWIRPTVHAVCVCLVAFLNPSSAATLAVNSPGDAIAVDGAITLREALASCNLRADVNADVAAGRKGPYGVDDRIKFGIASGTAVIAVGSALPPVRYALRLDGTTQPGFVGTPLVVIDGAAAGAGASGLSFFDSATVTVSALVVRGFGRDGIEVADRLFADGFEPEATVLPVGPAGSVTLDRVVSRANGRHGIAVFGGLLALGVEVAANGSDGVVVDSGRPVSIRGEVHLNAGAGIDVRRASASIPLAIGNPPEITFVHDNTGDGVVLGNQLAQIGAVNAEVRSTTISRNEIGLRVEQRHALLAPTTTRIRDNTIHDNRAEGVRLSTSFQTARGAAQTRPFALNRVFHNAMGAGCSSPQPRAQIQVIGPVAVPPALAAACAAATKEDKCEDEEQAGNPCQWTGSTCIAIWDLTGGSDCSGQGFAPNEIHSFNTDNDSVGSSELSVGLYASDGADVWADQNSWRSGAPIQNVDKDASSSVDANNICTLISQCSSQ